MGLGDSDVTDGNGGGGGAAEVASACSICLEAVMIGGGRSTAKLQCGHEFHLDCIGSAFNAKGMMQCPNCRNVEKGNWIYGNGYCFLPAFNMDEWTHDEDLYDLNYLEMPYGVHWCPVSGIGRATSSFENGDSFPPVAFQDLVGHHAISTELPSISMFAHPCPHLSGFHPVQPSSAPTSYASSDGFTDSSYYPQWSQVVDSPDVTSHLSLPTNDAHYHGWDHYQSRLSHSRDISTASIQASVSHTAPRSTWLEDGGPPRADSLFYSFIDRHGSHTSFPVLPHFSSNRARALSGEHSTSYTDPRRSGNSRQWSSSNQSGFYMYHHPPVSFNSSIGDMMNTRDQFQRLGVQFVPFTSQLLSPVSMESGSWTGFTQRQLGQVRSESPPYGSIRLRPYV